MAEEEKPETTEEPQDAEPRDAEAAGPAEEASGGPASEAPAGDSEEEAPAEEAPAEEAPAEEAPAEESPAEEAPAEEAPAEEALSEDAATEATEGEGGAAKKPDLPPGADLDPIALETEAELSAEERARRDAEAEERARREAELTGDAEPEPVAVSRTPAEIESGTRYLATGKRKRSIARVTLMPGEGRIEVNKRTLEQYFPRPLHQTMARQPLAAAGYEGTIDVKVRVHGGGTSGQAGAVRHGIARALTEIDPELRGDLKRRGFLTRDARVKERRKAGLKKARKRPQFSKR
jgi:small subunit ribosomal protein S9